jgi:phage terminase small subunit
MAGVKGRSGGPRKNSGGARPGAGRKPKPKTDESPNLSAEGVESIDPLSQPVKREPLEFLELVMNDPTAPLKDRIRAGVAAAQYRHTKRGDGGKKEEQAGKAEKAAGGRFGPRKPPLSVVSGGR